MNEHAYSRKEPKRRRNTHNCCVPQCTALKTGSNRLHPVPKDAARRKAWTVAIKTGKALTEYMRVCSKHFKKEDYIATIVGSGLRPKLKKSAIPSQCLPVRSHDKVIVSPMKRQLLARADRAMKRAVWEDGESHQESFCDAEDKHDGSSSSDEQDHSSGEEWADGPEISEADEKTFASCGIQTDELEVGFILTILQSDSKLFTITGLHSVNLLNSLTKCCDRIAPHNPKGQFAMCTRDRILLTMTKIKLSVNFSALAVFFHVSVQTCINYFCDMVVVLAKVLKCMVTWADKEDVLKNMPKCFSRFKCTRVVLDCYEIPVEKPKCIRCRILTYSHYKKTHTIKLLMVCAPSGLITHNGVAFGGRASDKYITQHSGIYSICEPRDGIMVDKGFNIEEECEDNLLTLIRPPFMRQKRKFSKAESVQCARIARARVHVERVIQRVREYKIMAFKFPWHLCPYVDDIVTVVLALVNLSNPIMGKDKY